MSNKSEMIIQTEEQSHLQVNEVTLTGSAVHMYVPEGREIAVLTIATNAGLSGRSNFPKVTWYGDKARIIADTLTVSSDNCPRVSIKAMVQTSKRVNGEEVRYFQTIVGHELSYAQRQLEGRLNLDIGNQYVADKNEVVLLGELVHIYHFGAGETSNGSILTVKVRNDHRINFPKVTVFRQQHEIAKQMTVGGIIAVAGMIQTSRTAGERRAIYRESIVGTDLDWYHAENL